MSPSKMATVVIQPQRRIGGQWANCPPHKAQVWTVLVNNLLLGRYAKSKEAAEAARVAAARRGKMPREYNLGTRMPPKKEGVGSIVIISRRASATPSTPD